MVFPTKAEQNLQCATAPANIVHVKLAVDMKEASDQDNQEIQIQGKKWEFLHFSYDNSMTSEHVRSHGTAAVPDTAEMPLDGRTSLIFHPGPDTLSPRCKNWS